MIKLLFNILLKIREIILNITLFLFNKSRDKETGKFKYISPTHLKHLFIIIVAIVFFSTFFIKVLLK